MAAALIYEAYDRSEDEDEEYGEGVQEEYFVNDEAVEPDWDEADEDDYGPGVTVSWNKSTRQEIKVVVSDVPEEAYLDPLGLVNCWEEALSELKEAHTDRFLPPSEAPRSTFQKQTRAPLWYGASTIPNPAPVPSTSKLPSPRDTSPAPTPTATSHNATNKRPQPVPNSVLDTHDEEPLPKKRKRLTGSQKKARKAAKLAHQSSAPSSTAYTSGRVLNPSHVASSSSKEKARALDDGDHEAEGQAEARSNSPDYQPQSPTFATSSLESSTQGRTGREVPPHLATLLSTQPSPPRQQAETPTSTASVARPPQPAYVPSSIPTTFPSPPPITPLTGHEPALEPETSESLLESALWSWYTAGYQTALYHASVGVATFKSSSEDATTG
ncbi:hypothetical protein JCM16303_006361 [Sporobolomyces ruberrimus]